MYVPNIDSFARTFANTAPLNTSTTEDDDEVINIIQTLLDHLKTLPNGPEKRAIINEIGNWPKVIPDILKQYVPLPTKKALK